MRFDIALAVNYPTLMLCIECGLSVALKTTACKKQDIISEPPGRFTICPKVAIFLAPFT
jgi:hypothetical protein